MLLETVVNCWMEDRSRIDLRDEIQPLMLGLIEYSYYTGTQIYIIYSNTTLTP